MPQISVLLDEDEVEEVLSWYFLSSRAGVADPWSPLVIELTDKLFRARADLEGHREPDPGT